MSNQLLNTKFAVERDPSTLVGTNIIIIKVKGVEDPFTVVDNQNSVKAGLRTLGADLTQSLTKEYPIANQLTAVKYTVNATTVAAETITYTRTFDFSSGLFDSGDNPVFAFGIYLISGVSTTTLAQRLVKVTFTDTADTPVTFSKGGGVNVDEFDYVIGNETNTNQDLTGFDEAIIIPLDKLQQSTTKQFSSVQIKFALPVNAQFALYKMGVYRAPEDCAFIRPSDIIIENPKAFTRAEEPNVGEMKGALGNFLGPKERVGNLSMSFETDELNDEHVRILKRNKKYTGGKQPSTRVEVTIPDTYPYEISTQVADLENVTSTKDIWIQIREVSGAVKDAKVIEGGEYLPAQTVRFYNVAPTKRLRFSPQDKGKKAIIQVNYVNPDAVYEVTTARGKTLYATVIRIVTDSTDVNSSRRRQIYIYDNATVSVMSQGQSVDNDNAENIKIDIKTLAVSPSTVTEAKHYTQ